MAVTAGGRFLAGVLLLLGTLWTALPCRAENYSDLWWNPAESGWGLSLTDHETQLFGVWFTYRADGGPTWFVVPGGATSEVRQLFGGHLYRPSVPACSSAVLPGLVRTTKVGSVRLAFRP